MRTKNALLVALVGFGVAMLVFPLANARSQGATTGKVTLESKSVAVGVGVSWGDGILEYQGKKYPFTINGLSVVDLGVSKVTARGEVKNLKKIEDFTGTYVAGGAGAAVGGGAGVAAMKNQNGVDMKLTGTSKGVKFALAAAGVEVKLKQ